MLWQHLSCGQQAVNSGKFVVFWRQSRHFSGRFRHRTSAAEQELKSPLNCVESRDAEMCV